jgi:hypothetical protein
MLILPRGRHSLGISDTGTIQEKWRGYALGAQKTMTDWTHGVLDAPSEIGTIKQEGVAEVTGIHAKVMP